MASSGANSFGNNIKDHLDKDSQNVFNKARSLLLQAETRRSIIVNKNLYHTDNKHQKDAGHTDLIDANMEASITTLFIKNSNNSDLLWLFGMLCAHRYKYGVSDKKRKKKDKNPIKYFDKCIKLNPHHADCYCSYGVLLFELHKINKADQMFKQCLSIDSCNHRANYYYAEYWRLKGSYDYAETFYQAAIENNNDNIINSYHLVGYGEFLTSTFKRRHQDAEKHFINAQKLNPDNDFAYYFYAQLLKQTGKITFAIANTKKAIKVNSQIKQYCKFLHCLNLLKPKIPIPFVDCTSLSKSPSHSETTASNHSESKNNMNESEFKDNLNVSQESKSNTNVIKQNGNGNIEQGYEIKTEEQIEYAEKHYDICEIEFIRFLNDKIKFDKYYPDLYERFEQAQCNDIRFLLHVDDELLKDHIKMKPIHCKEFCSKVAQFQSEVEQFRDWLRNIIAECDQFPVDSLIELFGNNGIWTRESFHRYILNKNDLNNIIGEIYPRNNIINAIWNDFNASEGADEMVDMLRDDAFPTLDNYFKSKNINNPLIGYHDLIIEYFKKESIYCNSSLNIKQEQFVIDLCAFIDKNDDINYKKALKKLYRIIDCQQEKNCSNSKELEGVQDDENMLSFKVTLQQIIDDSDKNVRNEVAEIRKMLENQDPNANIMTYPLWSNGQSVNGSVNSTSGTTNNKQNGSDKNYPNKSNHNNSDNNANNSGNGNGNNNFYQLYYNQQICNRDECVANRSLLMVANQQLYDKQIETSQLCQYIQRLLEINTACKSNIRQLINGNYIPKQSKPTKKANKTKRRNSKIATTIGLTAKGSSYEPNELFRARGRNVKIEKALTTRFIPARIQHKILDLNGHSMVYKYIDKSLAMLNYDNNKFMSDDSKYDEVILDFDFIDKIDKKQLYCKMHKYAKQTKGSFKWQIMNKLFSKNDIGHNVLLCSPRKTDSFLMQLQQSDFVTQCLTEQIIDDTKWHKISVFNDKNNKKQAILSFDKEEFVKRVKNIIFSVNKSIDLIPIIMFQNDGYSIEHLLIVQGIETNVDIGISFIINPNTYLIEATGIHLHKSKIYEQHMLANPNHECHCLDSFKSNIYDILKIGNVNDDDNARKSLQKKNKDFKDFLYKFIDSKPTDYHSLKQCGQLLISKDNGKCDIDIYDGKPTDSSNSTLYY